MQCSQQAGPGACDQPGRRASPPSSACAFRTVKWPQHYRRQLWTITVTVAVAPNLGTAWARSSDHRQQCVFGYAGHNAAPQRPAHTAPAPAPAPAPTPTRCAVCAGGKTLGGMGEDFCEWHRSHGREGEGRLHMMPAAAVECARTPRAVLALVHIERSKTSSGVRAHRLARRACLYGT